MAFDVSQSNKLVSEMWRDTIQETDEFENSLWQMFNKMPGKTINTRGEKWKVRTQYNESESWAPSDGAAYAQGGNTTFQNIFVPYRHVSAQAQITQEAIDNDNASSQYHPVADEMASLLRRCFKNLNQHAAMDNGTGQIGVVTANYNGGTPTVATLAPTTVFGNKGAQFANPSKKVQFFDATGTTLRNGTIGGEGIVTISSRVQSTGAVTMTSNLPSDLVTTDIMVPERSGGLGPHGLEYWVANTGNLFQLSRVTNPGLQSILIDGSSGSILMLMETLVAQQAFYQGESVAYGTDDAKSSDIILWSPTNRQRYRQEAIGTGMTMLGEGSLDLGFGYKETINGMKTVTANDASNTKIYKLHLDDWYRLALGDASNPFQPREIHGNKMYNLYDASNRVASAYGMVLDGYVNFACKNVRNQAAIYNLPTAGLATGNN